MTRLFNQLSAITTLVLMASAINCPAALDDDAIDLGESWMQSPWFGSYYDAGSDWRYQPNWGWIYEVDGGTDSMWFYSASENDWYWANGDYYPIIYRYADAGWVYYWKETIDPRLYYNYTSTSWTASDDTDGSIWHSYYSAIVDAETAEYDEISNELTAINDYNDTLPWNDSHTMITVASWMSSKYISSYVVGETLTPSWDMWVTVSGEAQWFAQDCGLTGDDLTFRMKQLIGLPPDSNYTYWVEFMVNPDDLYRPSADPDPTDREAELDYPDGDEERVSASYRTWFEDNAESSYVLARWGYPWTRLGYTYDWGSDTTEAGLSEFIIRQGATILITGVYTNAQYLETE